MTDNNDFTFDDVVLVALYSRGLPKDRFDIPVAAEALRQIDPNTATVAKDRDRFIRVLLDHVRTQEPKA